MGWIIFIGILIVAYLLNSIGVNIILSYVIPVIICIIIWILRINSGANKIRESINSELEKSKGELGKIQNNNLSLEKLSKMEVEANQL